jgi:enoyl-CoA hydratase
MFEVSDKGDVAIVTMAHGKANALDIELCEALAARFHEFRTSPARAVVLTGQGKIFCAGVDLVRLLDGGAPYVRKFLPALEALYDGVFSFPKPIVSAMNGHAIAGGCVLAAATDRRIMARDAGRVGVTELQVGVPFPPLAFEIMRHVTAPQYFEEVMLGAATYAPQDAAVRGLVDEIVEPATLLDRAIATAQSLAAIAAKAYALSKQQLRHTAFERLQREGRAWDAKVAEIWTAPETANRIRDYVARTLKRA